MMVQVYVMIAQEKHFNIRSGLIVNQQEEVKIRVI